MVKVQVSIDPHSPLLMRAAFDACPYVQTDLTELIHVIRWHMVDEVLYTARIVEALGRVTGRPETRDPPSSTLEITYTNTVIDVSCGPNWGFMYLKDQPLPSGIRSRRYFKYEPLRKALYEVYDALKDITLPAIRVRGIAMLEFYSGTYHIEITVTERNVTIEVEREVTGEEY